MPTLSPLTLRKWLRKFIIVFLCFGFIITYYHYRSSSERHHPRVVNIGYLRVPNDEMLAISQDSIKQALAKENINVHFTVFDSGVEANQALASKSIDFASMGITNGVIAMSKNLPVELIWIHEILGTNEGLVVKDNQNIHSLSDLKGKTLATTFASTSHFSLQKTLESQGLQKDITLLDMKSTDIMAAWQRGNIDGVYTWEPTLNNIQKQGGLTLLTSKDLAEAGYPTANIMVGRKDFITDHPNITQTLLQCLSEAKTFYHQQPDQAAQQIAKALEISPELAQLQMSGADWLSLDQEKQYLSNPTQPGKIFDVLKNISQFLYQTHILPKEVTDETIRQFINGHLLENLTEKGGEQHE